MKFNELIKYNEQNIQIHRSEILFLQSLRFETNYNSFQARFFFFLKYSEISPGCSLEGMMLKLKLQYFGHLMQRVDSWKRLWCWEGLGAGGKGTTEDEMAGWHHRLNGREFEWTLGDGDGQGGLVCCDSVSKCRTRLSDWTELNWTEDHLG